MHFKAYFLKKKKRLPASRDISVASSMLNSYYTCFCPNENTVLNTATKQINIREVYMFVKAIKQVEAKEEKG